MDENDDRAGGLLDDLLDQVKRVLGAFPEPHEGDVRAFPRCHRPDVLDLDLACDHFVSERGDDRHDESQAILALVRDQYTQMLGFAVAHSWAPRVPYPLPDLHNRPVGRGF